MRTSALRWGALAALGWSSGCPSPGAVDIEQLAGGSFEYQVTHEWEGSDPLPQLPSDELADADYAATDDGARWSVVFSEDGGEVELAAGAGAQVFTGTDVQTDDQRVRFELVEGTVAGGHFAIWSEGATLAAELTLYGSGVPIVESTRGVLEE